MGRYGIKTVLKAFIIIIGICVGLILCCGASIWIAFSGLCQSEVFQEVYSPDIKFKVVVFQRDCGATTDFSTQVSILRASDELGNESGNIFRLDEHPDWTNVQVDWISDRSVMISYSDGYNVYLQKDKFRRWFETIAIHYQVRNE